MEMTKYLRIGNRLNYNYIKNSQNERKTHKTINVILSIKKQITKQYIKHILNLSFMKIRIVFGEWIYILHRKKM